MKLKDLESQSILTDFNHSIVLNAFELCSKAGKKVSSSSRRIQNLHHTNRFGCIKFVFCQCCHLTNAEKIHMNSSDRSMRNRTKVIS